MTENTVLFSKDTSRKAMNFAIFSSWFGAISQIMIRDSSIVILYARQLGGSNFLSLLTTALYLFSSAVLIIPAAHIMEHTGKKRLVLPAITLGMMGVLIAASAGFFPEHLARGVLLIGLIIYSLTIAVYLAGWFPLLRGVVPEKERGTFFGRLRVSWQTVLTVFLLISTFVVGKDASLLTLQTIIGISGVLIIGRIYFVARIPETPKKKPEHLLSFKNSIRNILKNRALVRFALYLLFLYLFANATVPVGFLFAKSALGAPDNYVVLLSVLMNVGSILGYFLGGVLFGRFNTKRFMLFAHACFALLNFLLLLVSEFSLVSAVYLGGIITLYGGMVAFSTIGASSEMLALASPKTINMSIAFCYAFDAAGKGLSRIISGLLLDSPFLPTSWNFLGANLGPHHFLFISFGVLLVIGFVFTAFVPPGAVRRAFIPRD